MGEKVSVPYWRKTTWMSGAELVKGPRDESEASICRAQGRFVSGSRPWHGHTSREDGDG